MNITYKEKDIVLKLLCSEEIVPEISIGISREEIIEQSGLDTQTVASILKYFERNGLISDLNYRHSAPSFSLVVHQEAFDVLNRGGFTMQEEVLQKEVQKLLLEIERLKPSVGDKIETISTIANNIAGVVGSFFGGWNSIKPL
ncbi:MAG: hypothetical protein IJ057_09605 [Bacteroidales bacterium]|nr:hypothetical protein [Bacteroidales bacterium]